MVSLESPRGSKLWMMRSRGRLAEESRSMKHLENFSPKGLKVLVVDDDPLCLMVLERMLKQCDYNVTTCTRVPEAISMVIDRKDSFDLVMSDVYMPDEDGFRLLEIIGLTLDLPVIMMSADAETSMVMKGITHGACDYLIKPVRMEELRNIWQHVVRRKGRENLREEYGESDHDHETKAMDSSESTSKKRKDSQNLESFTEIIDDISSLKKTRIHWTVQLHQQFVDAVNQLGIDKAVPKKIIELMGVQGLTRENVASHLQKYRLYLKRLSGAVPEPYPVASFQAAEDGKAGGAMHVQAGGKGSYASSSCSSSPGVVKGSNLGAGINPKAGFRMGRIDQATLKSLEQYRAYEQKLAANRAQVLGGIGIAPSKQAKVGQLPDTKWTSGLQRMASVDLSLLWKAQRDLTETANPKPAGTSIVDDSVTQTLKIAMKVEEFGADMEYGKASSFRHSRTRSMSYWPSDPFPPSTPDDSILLEEIKRGGRDAEDMQAQEQQEVVDHLFDSFVEDYEIPVLAETHPHQQSSASAGFQETSGSVNPDTLSYSVEDISGYLLDDILPKTN